MGSTAGVVDVGSNTLRLLVGRWLDGGLVPVCTQRARLGLGREIEETGGLSELALSAAAREVRKLCAAGVEHDADPLEILVTAPGRQAENGDELVRALERGSGRAVRVLSGDEEARLSFAGALATSARRPTGLVAVIDLGGASTEIAIGRPDAGPGWLRSVDAGALRLTSRLLATELPAPKEVEEAHAAVAEAFDGLAPPLPRSALVVGGSARALGKLAGHRLGADELAEAGDVLAHTTHDQVVRRFGVGRHRASLVLAGALILAEVQRRLLVPLEVVDGGLREGALLAALESVAA